jgi:hypothetical protein
MRIFAVITVARQIGGEYVFVKTERGFHQAKDADVLLRELKEQYTLDGRARPITVSTPQGEAQCMCEAGVFEIEIDDLKEENG